MNALDITADEKYCVFLTGGTWFALPATSIREVAGRPILAIVPRSNPVLAGLCHDGSEFLPVLRLPSRASHSSHSSEQKTIVLQGPNGAWALLIDQVHGIESLECSHDTEGYLDDWSTAVMGTSTLNDNFVRILNADGLYRLAEQILKRDWAEFSTSTTLTSN